MTTKKSLEADAVAAFRAGAERRRAQKNLQRVLAQSLSESDVRVNYEAGPLTIRKPVNAKPVSSLGGATKVFGRSSISIPEMTRFVKRSTR